MPGVQSGLWFKNGCGKKSFVGLDSEASNKWLAGEEEKYTCKQADPVALLNRTYWYARIILAVQEFDGSIYRQRARPRLLAPEIAETAAPESLAPELL
jgi:hypothetical protein